MTKYRWIREDLEINFPIAAMSLRDLFHEAEELDLAGDDMFFPLCSRMHLVAKGLVVCGFLTQDQYEIICHKYPDKR